MALNPNLILAGQPFNALSSIGGAAQVAGNINALRADQEKAQIYRDHGAGIASGDVNSLNALAQIDPGAVWDMRRQQAQDAQRSEAMAYQRQQDQQRMGWAQDERSYQRGRDEKSDNRDDQEWMWKTQQYAASLSAAEREAQTKQIEGALAGATHFWQRGDQAGYEGFLKQNGQDPAQFPFDNFPAYANKFADVVKLMRGGDGTEYGLNPIYGRDPSGNLVPMQLAKDGTARPTKLPEGYSADPRGQSFERAAGSAEGKIAGEATATLGPAEIEAEHAVGLVDGLLSDPYLPKMVGPVAGRMPNFSGDSQRVQSKMDQVSGQAFMAARQFLKGQGQITDFESRRAEAAMARLNAAQNYEDYRQALEELKDALQVGLMKARAAAQGGRASGSPQPQQGAQRVQTDDQYDALPSGSTFVGPDGIPRRKP